MIDKIFSTLSDTELLDAQISYMVKVSGTIPSEMEVTLLLYNLFMGWDGICCGYWGNVIHFVIRGTRAISGSWRHLTI